MATPENITQVLNTSYTIDRENSESGINDYM